MVEILYFKGHGTVAASSSIPSKYQTIVVNNSEKKGFLSRAKRFQDLGFVVRNHDFIFLVYGRYRIKQWIHINIHYSCVLWVLSVVFAMIQNENPGPGTYKDPVCLKDEASPSYSKHGTMTFASKVTYRTNLFRITSCTCYTHQVNLNVAPYL